MRKIIFTLAVIYLCSNILHAQDATIKGRVVDTHSSEVIPDVELRILSSDFETQTDEKGLFVFTGTNFPQGEQILVVRMLNYITQSIPITIQNGETINLDPIIMDIDLTELESQIGVINLSDNELDGDLGIL